MKGNIQFISTQHDLHIEDKKGYLRQNSLIFFEILEDILTATYDII